MEVEIKKSAKKDLMALDGRIRQQIADDILSLIHFPEAAGVKRLKGMPIKYRLRSGDWSIVFSVEWGTNTLYVESIKHRREIYK